MKLKITKKRNTQNENVNIQIDFGYVFLDILQIILITLKASNNTTWSWWLVLFPLWIGLLTEASKMKSDKNN